MRTNSVPSSKNAALETDYLSIIDRYDKDAQSRFPVRLGHLIALLDPEPRDILGQLFMQLELGNDRTGQFVTPPEICELMAQFMFGNSVSDTFSSEEFVMVCEPACGAGGMMLAFAKIVIEAKRDPGRAMWVQCQDIDRVAAMMCFLQLSLWNIPAVVIVGNTLTCEVREVFYMPAHRIGFWDAKLAQRVSVQRANEHSDESEKGTTDTTPTALSSLRRTKCDLWLKASYSGSILASKAIILLPT